MYHFFHVVAIFVTLVVAAGFDSLIGARTNARVVENFIDELGVFKDFEAADMSSPCAIQAAAASHLYPREELN